MGQQGQPLQYYVPAGQPGQPVQFQGAPAQPLVNEEEDVATMKIDIKYLKSGLNGSRIFEFVSVAVNRNVDHVRWLRIKKKNSHKMHIVCTILMAFIC